MRGNGVHIGDFDRRIEIWKPNSTAKNLAGQTSVTFAKHSTVWAKYETVGGGEVDEGGFKVANSDAKFTIRYDGAIDSTYHVLYDDGNRITSTMRYNIVRIDQVGRGAYLVLHCKHQSWNE